MVLLLGLAISIIHALEIKQVYKHSVWKWMKSIILQKKKVGNWISTNRKKCGIIQIPRMFLALVHFYVLRYTQSSEMLDTDITKYSQNEAKKIV